MSLSVRLLRALFAVQDVLRPTRDIKYRPDPEKLGVALGPDACYVEMDDGASLFYRSWLPAEPTAVAACLHGMGAYGGHLRVIGEYLQPRGVASFVFDLRGHGLSDGPRGDFTRMDRIISDLANITAFLKQQYPELPLFFLGESLAASFVLKYAAQSPDRLAGIILSSVEIKPLIVPKVTEVLRYVPNILWNSRASVVEMGERERLVSRDPEHFTRAQRDPLRTEKFSVRSIVETHALIQEWPHLARRLAVPCLILQGGGDLLTDPEGARSLHDAIPNPDKELAFFPGAYHGLFYDPAATEVLETVTRWIGQHGGGL